MRIGIVSIVQTSNSFSPASTTLDDFQQCRLTSGRDLINASSFQDPVCGAIARFLGELDIDAVPIVEALAPAGGPLDKSAIDGICQQLSDGVRQAGTFDRIIMHMTGSMLDSGGQPAERLFAGQLRSRLSAETPIVIVLDREANFSPELLDVAELVLALQDPIEPELPKSATDNLKRALIASGTASLHTSHRGPLLLVPLPNQQAANPATRRIEEVRQSVATSNDVVSANVCLGFPYADAPNAGATVWVTATSQATADDACEKLSAAVMSERDGLETVNGLLNVEEAVHIAMASPGSSFVLLETGDDPTGGAPGDGTGLLWGLLDLGAQNAVLAPLVDPAAIEMAFSAGEGSAFESDIGARLDRRHGYPVPVRGQVVRLVEAVPGHDSGRVALVEADGRHHGSVLIVLTERRIVIEDLAIFDVLGVGLEQFPIVAIKASTRPRSDTITLARELQTLLVATPGITVPDFGYFPYRHLSADILPGT